MRWKLPLVALALTCSVSLKVAAAPRGCPTKATTKVLPPPKTIILDRTRLVTTRRKTLGKKPSTVGKTFDEFIKAADTWLKKGPWTVTSKTVKVEGATQHDYTSQAPYWWPAVAGKPGSCPYHKEDGNRNKAEIDKFTDKQNSIDMMKSSYFLSLAWWYTGEMKYRCHASNILRTWFLDKDTKMNPTLAFAQSIPCKDKGRVEGIIDFAQQYTDVIDAVAILNTVEDMAWTPNDRSQFKQWNTQFYTWLKTSKFGKDVLKKDNNHAIFGAMQLSTIATYLGKTSVAKTTIQKTMSVINSHISEDGKQPKELERSKPWHYSTFTLIAWTRMVCVGDKLGLDLWNDGKSRITDAIEYLIPYADKSGPNFPHDGEGGEFKRFAAYDIVHFAADRGLPAAKSAVSKLEIPPKLGGDTWEYRPAVEQLDAGK